MPQPSRADLHLDDAVCASIDARNDLRSAAGALIRAASHLTTIDGAHRELRLLREEITRIKSRAA